MEKRGYYLQEMRIDRNRGDRPWVFILMAAAVLTALETKQRGLLISYNIRSVKGATDGNRSIDNNSAEPALKNFAVRRRNWLFAKSVRGAAASALVYSITETVLLNHLKPYAYLTYILDELRKMGAFPKEEELKKLLPWSEDLPEYCRTKLKK